MKPARLIVAGIAVAAGAAAMLMFGRSSPPQIVQAAPNIETEDVIVAARELPMGTVVNENDVRFEPWPRASVTPAVITKDGNPNAMADVKGSIARSNFLAGEPIRRDKLVKGANAGFLSAILPSGLRAVAINIDSHGSTTAGGFILPNDHVDIIQTYRDAEASKAAGSDVYTSQVILTNVRVLAIGPNIQEKNGEQVVVGETATLELDAHQAEVVVLAQQVGKLSLALRSMLDANEAVSAAAQPTRGGLADDTDLTIVRYGIAEQVNRR